MSQRCHFYGRRWIFRFLEVMTNDVRNVSWTCHFRVRRWEVKNAVNGGDFSLFMGRSWLVGQEQPAIFCFLFWAAIYPILPFVDRSSLSLLSRLPSLSLSPFLFLPPARSITAPYNSTPWQLANTSPQGHENDTFLTSFWHHSTSLYLNTLPECHENDIFLTSFQNSSNTPRI